MAPPQIYPAIPAAHEGKTMYRMMACEAMDRRRKNRTVNKSAKAANQNAARGYIDQRIVAAAVGANGSASLRNTGCQGIVLRGEVLFIEVDAKALNPLKTTSIHNAARMVESCATNPIRGGPARKPT